MIRQVIDSIEMDYSFKDVHYGVVYPVTSKGQRLPGSRDGKFYKDAIPDSSKKAIVYWEDYGSKLIESAPRFEKYVQKVRLVAWMNFGKIEDSYEDCLESLLGSIPSRIGKVRFKMVGQPPKEESIFDRYDYNIGKQYMTWPYDVAAFDFEITYYKICGKVYL